MEITLRPYQEEAKDAIFAEWNNGNKKTLLNLATGLGKTVVFSKVAEEFAKKDKKVLVLAHRAELLDQAADKIKNITGFDVSYEKASQTSLDSNASITLGSVQTVSKDKRLEMFDKHYFDAVIVDEAHHCMSPSYQKVLKHFNDAYVLGVTATPDRGDKKVLSEYFNSEAYEYGIRQGIENKYLCPIKAQMIPLKIDISNVSLSSGDFSLGESDKAIEPYLYEIASIIAKDYSDRKTVIFLPLVNTSKKMCEMLNSLGIPAVEINGKTRDRNERFKDFADGKYKVLCNAMLATEGWDCPSVDCIVILRPTKIRSFYTQMVGRGTRPFEGKDHLLLLDFLWLSKKHNLCRPSSLIAKDDTVMQFMQFKLERSGQAVDIMNLEEEAATEIANAHERALANKLAKMRSRKSKLIDPLQFSVSIGFDITSYEPIFAWEKSKPSARQLQILENNCFDSSLVTSKGLASKLIDHIINRSKRGMSTPKQIRFLENYGFEHVGQWKNAQASAMIGRISMNKWQLPKDVVPSKYQPI